MFLPVKKAEASGADPSFPFSLTYARADLIREFDQVQADKAV